MRYFIFTGMKKISIPLLTIISIVGLAGNTRAQQIFQPTWESLSSYQVPEWYKDAKFGIFIHWGLYSVPAFGSEQHPRQMYIVDSKEYRHHVATYGPQS